MLAARPILIRVVSSDVLKFKADVLVLKYAQALYGADSAVFRQLTSGGRRIRLPQEGNYVLVQSENALNCTSVLFVGVASLINFGYLGIRYFAKQSLAILADEKVEINHLAITVHGPGYGLDEQEAFESEIAGLVDALNTNRYPDMLQRISIVEKDEARAERLNEILQKLLPSSGKDWRSLNPATNYANAILQTAGQPSSDKRHIFIAMPFAEEMDDTFHYGIESAVKTVGMLCERADLSIFSGDIMEWVKNRIRTAALVVADLTKDNPNVYLEVGYAWGCAIPTVLLCKQEARDLKFDIRGHRCLIYKNIRHLEELLTRELNGLIQSR